VQFFNGTSAQESYIVPVKVYIMDRTQSYGAADSRIEVAECWSASPERPTEATSNQTCVVCREKINRYGTLLPILALH